MIDKRIDALARLGAFMLSGAPSIQTPIQRAWTQNPWFTPSNIKKSIENIARYFLDRTLLESWVSRYPIRDKGPLDIGLVMAGNIPLVGMHDWIVAFMAGYDTQIKLSSKDKVLLPFFVNAMYEMVDSSLLPTTRFVDRLRGFDAIIATGSDNTAMHFEYYFKDYPNIIRHNRNSVAFLRGNETEDQLIGLGHDVFDYFGLGCRSVSHLLLPGEYDISMLLSVFDRQFADINEHHKYRNNYDYNLALYLLNKIEHHSGSSIILKRDDHIASRIASLNYSYYSSEEDWPLFLDLWKDKIQVVVLSTPISDIGASIGSQVAFGESQHPGLSDYADGVDTMEVLTGWYQLAPQTR